MSGDLKPVVIMGANASGKTRLAAELADALGGEIISADSKQVYKHLKAGTSKPDGRWVKKGGEKTYLSGGIPCHLVDILDPKETYNAGSFAGDAGRVIAEIRKRGKTPIMVGGTGLYIQAFWNGMDDIPPSKPEIRKRLMEDAEKLGKDELYRRLRKSDPKAAAGIHPANLQRIVRALEVKEITGKNISHFWSGKFHDSLPAHLAAFVFIKRPKNILAKRIKNRTLKHFEEWAHETENLISMGYPEDCPGLKSLGYPQMLDFLKGKSTKEETVEKIVRLSLSYAKRQNTWFSKYANIIRLEVDGEGEIEAGKILSLMRGNAA